MRMLLCRVMMMSLIRVRAVGGEPDSLVLRFPLRIVTLVPIHMTMRVIHVGAECIIVSFSHKVDHYSCRRSVVVR